MVWAKVDDRLHASVKWRSASKGARALWTTALSWCADQETDGHVPLAMLPVLDGTRAEARSLVDAGLWTPEDDGFRFSKWAEYQPTREKLDEKRKTERERIAEARAKRRAVGSNTESTHVGVGEVSALPDPTRPDPTPPSSDEEGVKPRGARGTRVPRSFVITDEMREWALENAPHVDVDKKLGEWIDYWTGVAGRAGLKLDWVSTWRNGMRKQEEFALRDIARFGDAAPAAAATPKAVF